MTDKAKAGRAEYMKRYMRKYRMTPRGAENVKRATTRFFERQRDKQLQQEARRREEGVE